MEDIPVARNHVAIPPDDIHTSERVAALAIKLDDCESTRRVYRDASRRHIAAVGKDVRVPITAGIRQEVADFGDTSAVPVEHRWHDGGVCAVASANLFEGPNAWHGWHGTHRGW